MFGPDGPDPDDVVDRLLMHALTRKGDELALERDRGRARLIASEVSRLFPKTKRR